jgi:hypothetical protein
MTSSPSPPVPERSWLHWGLIVAGLYLTWFVALTLPLVMTCFVTVSDLAAPMRKIPWDVYQSGVYWALIAVLFLSQFLFLRVPVRLVTKRPVSRRSIMLPVAMAGFWFGLLVWGGGVTLLEVSQGMGEFRLPPWVMLTVVAGVSWAAWFFVFFRISRAATPEDLIKQQSRWLLRGSILELLIAVPSHIVARGRGDCCAGFLTFIGITMGVGVMLLSFGPSVFLLYHARWKRLHQAK